MLQVLGLKRWHIIGEIYPFFWDACSIICVGGQVPLLLSNSTSLSFIHYLIY